MFATYICLLKPSGIYLAKYLTEYFSAFCREINGLQVIELN